MKENNIINTLTSLKQLGNFPSESPDKVSSETQYTLTKDLYFNHRRGLEPAIDKRSLINGDWASRRHFVTRYSQLMIVFPPGRWDPGLLLRCQNFFSIHRDDHKMVRFPRCALLFEIAHNLHIYRRHQLH